MPPRLIIIDDVFGRNLPGGRNTDRENLCAHFLWQDTTADAAARACRQKVLRPTAEVVFCRAQTPTCANLGDLIENDLESALEAIRKGWAAHSPPQEHRIETPWSLLLLDLCFYTGRVTKESHQQSPGMPEGRPGDDDVRSYFGLTLLDAIHSEFPELPIFILSSKPRDEVSLEFSRRGALGFIARDDMRGSELLEAALWQHGLLSDPSEQVVGHSLPVLLALREARRAAGHRENVLIRGERGTGKELLAHYVHRCSNRRTGLQIYDATTEPSATQPESPFVTVNSAVFTPNLFGSELFGIQPRTATGVDGKIGLIESANHGDLFLDEIADMSREVQGAMLRVLQERKITPVGSRKAKSVDVRFLSATNADLEDETRGFRLDLLDRLRIGGTVWLPPLRERPSDIPLLTKKFVREAEGQRKTAMCRQITPEVLDALRSHDWPGNIRELRSVIFDAVNRHPDVEHFVPAHLRFGTGEPRKVVSPIGRVQSRSASDRLSISENNADSSLTAFARLVHEISQFEFDPSEREDWAGKFGLLQSALARLIADYVKAALVANRRPTPENPKGDILIHPAMKLLTGDPKLTASKAADVIKRYLSLSPTDRDEILKDEVLREAYDIAVRLRPTVGRKQPHSAKTRAS